MEDKFKEIYDLYKNNIYRLALSYTKNYIDSEDIVQNVFIKYYKKINKVDNDKVKNWLIKVTINECKTYFLSPWRKHVTELSDENYKVTDKQVLFLKELSKLNKKDSLIIHLYYYEGYKISEISKILRINESTIKSRLCRARLKLKDLLEDSNEI